MKIKTIPLGECKYRLWKWVQPATGELTNFSCRRWNCAEHRYAVAYKWSTRIAETVRSKSNPNMKFFTITQVPEVPAIARFCWQRFVRFLRRYYQFEYVRVTEVGSDTGMLHWHCIVDSPRFIPQRWLSGLLKRFGLGYVADIRKIYDGDRVASYIASYLGKSGCPDGYRKVTSSRGFLLPRIQEMFKPVFSLVRNAFNESFENGFVALSKKDYPHPYFANKGREQFAWDKLKEKVAKDIMMRKKQNELSSQT